MFPLSSGIENGQSLTSNLQSRDFFIPGIPLEPHHKTVSINSNLPVSATASVIKLKPTKKNQDLAVLSPLTETLLAKSTALPLPQPPTPGFTSSTATVLAPKTADMESGFLVFTEDNKAMTILPDAEDLTHLAPDAGDLCVSMLPDMDFNDLCLFDDLFNESYNSSLFTDEEISADSDKLKSDSYDGSETESMMKKFNSSQSYFEINDKDLPDMKSLTNYDQQFLSNDPFLSFSNQTDELFSSSSTLSNASSSNKHLNSINPSSSMSDLYSSSSSTSSSSSPTNSSSCSSMQFSPQSSSTCDGETTNVATKLNLCDNSDFIDDKDMEMRAPFIPIDDDYLLGDMAAFTDGNMDDLFNWISNNNSKQFDGQFGGTNGQAGEKLRPKIHGAGGCLEALLQNDDLVFNLKNKLINSNQIVANNDENGNGNKSSFSPVKIPVASPVVHQQTQQPQPPPMPSTLKRKNSNILIYTALNVNSATSHQDKRIKNNNDSMGSENKSPPTNVHHFVLTKNNELIPKANFDNQSFKSVKKVEQTGGIVFVNTPSQNLEQSQMDVDKAQSKSSR